MLLSLVIPRCDDSRALAGLLNGIRVLEATLPYDFQVVCGTSPRQPQPEDSGRIDWIVVNQSSHGARTRATMQAAHGQYRALLDPRWLVEPEQLLLLLPPVQHGFDICIASRLDPDSCCVRDSWLGRMKRRVWRQASKVTLTPDGMDFLAPIQVYRSEAARALFSRSLEEGPAITLEVLSLAERMGLVIRQQAVDFRDQSGPQLTSIRDIPEVIMALGRIRFRLETGAYPLLDIPLPPPHRLRPRP